MQREEAATVIGESLLVTGQLSGDQDMTVLGRVEGTIQLSRTLYVDVGGIVKADVEVANAVISGIVVGNVTASQSVQVTETGRLVGDLRAPRIVIVAGARVRGQVEMSADGARHRELPASAQAGTQLSAPAGHKAVLSAAQKAAQANAAMVARSSSGRFERLSLPQRRPMAAPSVAVRRTAEPVATPKAHASASANAAAASGGREHAGAASAPKRSSRPKRRGSHRRPD